jgi:atlastin
MSSIPGPLQILNTKTNVTIDLAALNSVLDKVGNLPFACYSINGKKRTGKSFMLGYFLKYLKSEGKGDWMNLTLEPGFEWRGGTALGTEGIHIWSEPLIRKVDGREMVILLLDTQGSFDSETTFLQNAAIFAISTLLSSVLIFNVMNDVADTLQFLQYFIGYADLAITRQDTAEDEEGAPFQSLLFLLRDYLYPSEFMFGYYDDECKPVTQERNFKLEMLNVREGQPEDVRFTHGQILKSFQDVGAYLMPEPEKGLKYNDNVEQMGDEFKEFVKDFVERVLDPNRIVLKTVSGVRVTGTELKGFVKAWEKLFRDEALPQIDNLYNTTVKAQFQMAFKTALDYFDSEMKAFVSSRPDGVSDDALNAKKILVIVKAEEVFNSRNRMGGKETKEKFLEEFAEEAEARSEVYSSINTSNLSRKKMQMEFEAQVRTQATFRISVSCLYLLYRRYASPRPSEAEIMYELNTK